MSTLFGGSKSSSKPKDMTPAEFKALRAPLAATLGQITGGTEGDQLGGVPQFEGPLVAEMTDQERAILGDLVGMAGPNTSRNQLIERTLAGNFLPGQAGANPYLEAAIKAAQRTTQQGLVETLDRTLPGKFTQGGQFVNPQGSSAFDRAAAIATRGAADAMADIATNMSFQGYEAERGRQQAAISLSAQEVDQTMKTLSAAALPRLIEDLGLERGLEQFNTRMQALIQALSIQAGLAAPTIANQTTSTTSPNIVGTILGGIKGTGLMPSVSLSGGV